MIVIGELINASRKTIGVTIEAGDADTIQKEAKDQTEAGADFIDVNAGIFVGKELEYLKWLVQTVRPGCVRDALCHRQPGPQGRQGGSFGSPGHKIPPMINPISLEKERYNNLMPIVAGTDMKVIALCMRDEGMPQTVDDRLKIAEKLVNGLVQNNVSIASL